MADVNAAPSFYQLLQMSPQALWAAIHRSPSPGRRRYLAAMAVRSVLLVAFAVLFIGGLTALFGPENSSLVVGGFCMLLGIKFVPLGYRVSDSVAALAVTLILMVVGGVVSLLANPWISFGCDLVFLAIILFLVAQDPPMGNGGTYVFTYLFVSQTPVVGTALTARWVLALVLWLCCAAVLVHRHRDHLREVRLADLIHSLSFHDEKVRWQLRMALVVSLVVLLGNLLSVGKTVWMGYAAMSMLLPYGPQGRSPRAAAHRGLQRAGGVVLGSALYWLLVSVLPPEAQAWFGPVAGLLIGFSSRYFWNNVLNCFGALLLASAVWGPGASAALRVADNLAGIAFALGAVVVFWLIEKRQGARPSA